MAFVYARTQNNKKIIILDTTRSSLRLRQRSRMSNGLKVDPMKFASYKETLKNVSKRKVYGPYLLNTISKL